MGMRRAAPVRRCPTIRTNYRFDPPPRDGSNIVVPYTLPLTVYWDAELEQWIVVHPVCIETIDDFIRWRRDLK
jgi:hypothetical protein